jgi:hypothetical protein
MIEDGCKEVMLETEVRLRTYCVLCTIYYILCTCVLVYHLLVCCVLRLIPQFPNPSIQASNLGALSLYTKLGFVKDEKMAKYYLNGGDAYRYTTPAPTAPTPALTHYTTLYPIYLYTTSYTIPYIPINHPSHHCLPYTGTRTGSSCGSRKRGRTNACRCRHGGLLCRGLRA